MTKQVSEPPQRRRGAPAKHRGEARPRTYYISDEVHERVKQEVGRLLYLKRDMGGQEPTVSWFIENVLREHLQRLDMERLEAEAQRDAGHLGRE